MSGKYVGVSESVFDLLVRPCSHCRGKNGESEQEPSNLHLSCAFHRLHHELRNTNRIAIKYCADTVLVCLLESSSGPKLHQDRADKSVVWGDINA